MEAGHWINGTVSEGWPPIANPMSGYPQVRAVSLLLLLLAGGSAAHCPVLPLLQRLLPLLRLLLRLLMICPSVREPAHVVGHQRARQLHRRGDLRRRHHG